ncbi:M48 family metallopeptidase [Leucothrix arctica]|uniref:Peptidase M48 domain-containing protein n=1 Tax=Leucothrix arctica TaxID=1481894 RepID=A0A317C7D3_9GAMM|nr:M48 family metallopeptidase [Leucothrix arctica]PWQ94544.1 hypothetical protein DKT75_14705 [Leucothrix arctica]
MQYENPKIPEGINVTKVHPLKTFAILVSGLLVMLLVGAWLLGFGGGYLASKIPYSQEQRIADSYEGDAGLEQTELLRYLQALADKLSQQMNLEDGMDITIHYVDEGVDNAFATIGGHIFLYRGLLEKLPHENALAMLVAHEIAHVKHRDPIVSIGRGAAISVGMKLLLGDASPSLLGNAGLLTQMRFGRDMETKADQAGLVAVNTIYGGVTGALALFEILDGIEDNGLVKSPEFLSTHPASENRLDELREIANRNGWSMDNTPVPFPEFFNRSLLLR